MSIINAIFFFIFLCFNVLSNQCLELENNLRNVIRKWNGSNASVIIVGAGPAGIAAATKLLKNNFTNIKILEAENRIGGRIHSVKYGDQYVDVGAQFCHGEENNIVYNMVKDLNVLRHSSKDALVKLYLSNGTIVDQDIQKKVFDLYAHFRYDEGIDNNLCKGFKSTGECFELRYDTLLNKTEDEKAKRVLQDAKIWLSNFICTFDSSLDINDLSRESSYTKCGGDIYMNWNGHGYKTILEVMMGKFPEPSKSLPIDNKILLNKEVATIKNWKKGNPIEVTTTAGETFKANHVIFTASAGVLKADYEKLFNPQLPEDKVNAIQGIGFGATIKIILKFSEPLQNITSPLGIVWTKEDLAEASQKGFAWLQHLNRVVNAENNPKVLICWYAAGNVSEIEELSDEEIMNGQKFFVEKFLKQGFGAQEPEEIIRSSWNSNPHFRGSYSYDSVDGHLKYGTNFQKTLSKPLKNKNGKPTLLFAGEATHPIYFSTVHGAIETGYKQATRIINFYKKS